MCRRLEGLPQGFQSYVRNITVVFVGGSQSETPTGMPMFRSHLADQHISQEFSRCLFLGIQSEP